MKIANMFFKIAKGIEDVKPTEEHEVARTLLLDKIRAKSLEGKTDLLVYCTDIEGKNYNLRAFLTAEGFTLIDRPGKKVYILWNC